jgi:protein SCO1
MKKENHMARINYFILLTLLFVVGSCGDKPMVKPEETQNPPKKTSLPFFGEHDIELNTNSKGETIADTVFYAIPKFSFTNQNGKLISHRDYTGKVSVVDFFFTECPSICPILSAQMSRLQSLVNRGGLKTDVMFLSHSVKPQHDTPAVLLSYGEKLGADFTNWNFVTGSAEDIYDQAEEGYMLSAFPSDSAEGGVFHTDKITLLDRQMRIRGYYDGTSTKEVDRLFEDLKNLVTEKDGK